MPFQALAAAATLLTVAPHGNQVEFKLDRGSAELTWVSPGSFRFRRVLQGPLPKVERTDRDPVAVEIDDQPEHVRLRSRVLEITIAKKGVMLAVKRVGGGPLVRDLSEPRSEASGVTWEREAPVGTDFYGLGPRTDAGFSLVGKSLRAEVPFLASAA